MHELGHNFALAHSNDYKFPYSTAANPIYDDQTGMVSKVEFESKLSWRRNLIIACLGQMGYSYRSYDYPRMCFNPAKSWQLGWYSNKAITYYPTCTTVTYQVGGIIDYSVSSVPNVLVKLEQASSFDFYLTYNARASFNSDTQEGGNQVVIVLQGREGAGYSSSRLEAKLSPGARYVIQNFNNKRPL